MRYKVIKGTFHVAGFSPDGDSIRFEADNLSNWDYFNWKTEKKKNKKSRQLRFEAIDALETHYKECHQPRSFGIASLEVMLQMIGIENILYNIAFTRIVSADDGVPGFIAASALDVYQRPISLVFPGDTPLRDGDELLSHELPMEESINLKLIQLGLVYPAFYSSMQDDLINQFSTETRTARKNKVGIWSLDKTPKFTIWNKDTIENDIVILPKLFRRLVSFFEREGTYDNLKKYMKKKRRDKVLVRSSGENKKFSDLMEVNDREIMFLEEPENLIFNPKS